MARKQPTYNIRCFFEDGTPVTEENSYLSKVNPVVTEFQRRCGVKKLKEMPRDICKVAFKKLAGIID